MHSTMPLDDIGPQDAGLFSPAVRTIAYELEEDIIFGRMAPGARLIEETLMVRFGATRYFIRQALAGLERSGIVVREKNKGAAVRSLSPDEVQQIYSVREMLQREAALLISLPAPATLVRALKDIQAQFRCYVQDENHRRAHEMNDRFHLTLFAGCGNDYLLGSIRHYMSLSLPVRAKTMVERAMIEKSCQDHDLMISMLQGNNNWILAQLCIDHLQPSKRRYLEVVSVD